MYFINPLTPNDLYTSRTTLLTSKRCILYIYSTNVGTEYFKHALYSPFFFSSKCSLFHNVNLFGSCIIHILYTGCAEISKNNSGAKGLIFCKSVVQQHLWGLSLHPILSHANSIYTITPSLTVTLEAPFHFHLDTPNDFVTLSLPTAMLHI